jgi:peptidoglycan/xylan/chitin deacetylase (PgdA/CDA1 family)
MQETMQPNPPPRIAGGVERCRQFLKSLLFKALGTRVRLPSECRRAVLLTFDDGPHPEVTPAVLDLLARYRARAVFFVIGERVLQHPELVRECVRKGHAIGNHTHSHSTHKFWSVRPYIQDVAACQLAVRQATGRVPTLFRAPKGRVTAGSVVAPLLRGLRSVYWSVDPRDYRLQSTDEAVAWGERLGTEVCARDIVLLHDVNPHLLPLLEIFLGKTKERGLDLFTGLSSIAAYRPGEPRP